ncbi:MAG: SUMF1/EgtB/PvdO family nonheme iron enzyme [Phycisphaeraceae bacterium]|nr:SUMF1/EgtB/PvdO family nonheme iron enzyme [Phycisphaeraceae bacterium]
MKLFLSVLFLMAALAVPTWGDSLIKPLMPDPVANDEAALLAAARAVEPEILEGGYRQFDLVAARVGTWDGPVDLMVRLILPPGEHARPLPLVAYVHGGGFIGGSYRLNINDPRRSFSPGFRALSDEGFAIVSLGYRLAREAGWPAPVSDPLCGLRFLVRHGEHWGVDASRVGVIGHSAGARAAALLAMTPQDDFHEQEMPWRGAKVSFAAAWLWAGSALTAPDLASWEEFGKPRNYSVPRLHFGDHPAWDDETRHRLRIRNNLPHLSNAMPPIYMLRGRSDYGGDHSDARRAERIWKALGIEATVSIVPGGHSAAGPVEPLVAFFKRHLTGEPPKRPEHDPIATAEALLSVDEPMAALETLAAYHTTNSGQRPPAGQWLFLSDGNMMWLAETDDWPESHRAVADRAAKQLAMIEAEHARRLLSTRNWFGAQEAAANVMALDGRNQAMIELAETAQTSAKREAEVFSALSKANARLHAGEREAAMELLEGEQDARLQAALARLRGDSSPEKPAWADEAGIDVHGPWARVRLGEGIAIRFRWIEPGSWELPEHMRYRNRADQPWVQQVSVEHGFWLAQTPTTVAQWHAVSGEPLDPDAPGDAALSGRDYLAIVDWLEKLAGRHPDLLARLPTEDQWLHAATLGGRDDVIAAVNLHAVHALNVDRQSPEHQPVGGMLPTLGGLYDMLGGVQEWTASPGRHSARFQDERGRFRVLAYPIARGGAWSSMPHQLGWDVRAQHRHGNRQPDLGFRIAIGIRAEGEDWLRHVERP